MSARSLLARRPTPAPRAKTKQWWWRMVRTFGLSLLIGAGATWWALAPLPASGGGKPDSVRGAFAKYWIYRDVDALDERGFERLTLENAHNWYFLYREPIQSFDAYRNQKPPRPSASRRTIVLQPLGPMTPAQSRLVQSLAVYCGAFFQLPARVALPLGLGEAKRWARPSPMIVRGKVVGDGQYDADAILSHVLKPRLPSDAAMYLGITMADLHAADLNWVLGLGSLQNRTGVYSLCRYSSQFWNRKPRPGDEALLLRRSCQLVSHEAGHMLGLSHCVLYKCAMNGSSALGENDDLPRDYCPVCHRKLLWNVQGDGVKRYTELWNFYRQHGLTKDAQWMQQRLAAWEELQARGYHHDVP